MAGTANQLFVLPLELELGVLAMVEIGFLPALHVVAVLALLTTAAFVFVVFLVTGKTGLLEFFLVGALLVASVALYFLVPSFDGKFRVLAVIKNQLLPFLTAVTLLALGIVAPVMDSIEQVTAVALLGRILVVFIGVAKFAVDVLVLADQLPLSIVVMIEGLFAPALLVMALVALLTQLSLVRVIGLMTIETDA